MWTFFKNFVHSPASVGSVTPSSRYLVSAMVSRVDWRHIKRVAELGAGTGVITESINQVRPPGSRFYCFECNDSMRADLEKRFPDVALFKDAFSLREVLAAGDGEGLDCVISGLPFANFQSIRRGRLLRDVHACLNPGGVFLTFQYSRVLQPYLVSMYGRLESRLVWANLPPAFVFMCRKEAAPAGDANAR